MGTLRIINGVGNQNPHRRRKIRVAASPTTTTSTQTTVAAPAARVDYCHVADDIIVLMYVEIIDQS